MAALEGAFLDGVLAMVEIRWVLLTKSMKSIYETERSVEAGGAMLELAEEKCFLINQKVGTGST